jgi:hypothetical protein
LKNPVNPVRIHVSDLLSYWSLSKEEEQPFPHPFEHRFNFRDESRAKTLIRRFRLNEFRRRRRRSRGAAGHDA